MFSLGAIKELLVRFRLEVLATATYVLLVLSHLSPSQVIEYLSTCLQKKTLVGHYTTNLPYRTEYRDIKVIATVIQERLTLFWQQHIIELGESA